MYSVSVFSVGFMLFCVWSVVLLVYVLMCELFYVVWIRFIGMLMVCCSFCVK